MIQQLLINGVAAPEKYNNEIKSPHSSYGKWEHHQATHDNKNAKIKWCHSQVDTTYQLE